MLIRSRPLVCSIASFSCFGAQQPAGRAAWVGCTASANSTASSSPKEGLLLVFVELGRNDIRLVIFEPQAMQQRDQPRTAFGRRRPRTWRRGFGCFVGFDFMIL